MSRLLLGIALLWTLVSGSSVAIDQIAAPQSDFRPDETVAVVLNQGPYFTGLYHRWGCWWLRGATVRNFSRKAAEEAQYQPHHECMEKPVGANSEPPKQSNASVPQSPESLSPEQKETVYVRLVEPYLNGLYHRDGCWWLKRSGQIGALPIMRAEAERRYFRAHVECMTKPPGANSTIPEEYVDDVPSDLTLLVDQPINVRKSPSTDAPIVAQVVPPHAFMVYRSKDGWSRVCCVPVEKQATPGWIKVDYESPHVWLLETNSLYVSLRLHAADGKAWPHATVIDVALGNVRVGFSAEQARAALGDPLSETETETAGLKRTTTWTFKNAIVVLQRGRVISVTRTR